MNKWGFRCLHCKKPLAISSHGFCCRCTALINHQPYCTHCGNNLPYYHHGCGHCSRQKPMWHSILQISGYCPPLSEWIHRLKFQDQYWLDQGLARLLLLAFKNAQREYALSLPEVILPVPLYWERTWQRGYNQADLIAHYLAKWLAVPLDSQALSRIRPTAPQRELSSTARRTNLRSAFHYQPAKSYRRIALVDDVITTGSTLNTICKELLKQNVQEIQVWTLARVQSTIFSRPK